MKQHTVSDFENIALKNYAEKKTEAITETSPYVELCFDSKRIVVKKNVSLLVAAARRWAKTE